MGHILPLNIPFHWRKTPQTHPLRECERVLFSGNSSHLCRVHCPCGGAVCNCAYSILTWWSLVLICANCNCAYSILTWWSLVLICANCFLTKVTRALPMRWSRTQLGQNFFLT